MTKRMENARNLMLNNDIEAVASRAIKEECNEEISRLEVRLSDLNMENSTIIDIKPIAKESINSLRLLDEFYEKATVEGKRYLVGMLFPEKVTYDGAMYRTSYKNLAMVLICLKNKELLDKTKGQKLNAKSLSHKGWLMVPITAKFVADLKRLAEMPRRMKEFEELGKLMNRPF